jgi:hypothetical protein
MELVEMIIDNLDENGVDAISVVESPAIESNFVALSSEVKLAEVDKEKKILMGAVLIPNKPIYRRGEEGNDDYYIYFSKDTIRKASELFFKKGNQSESTLEHNVKLNGMTIVESWIVEDKDKDKSAIYGLDAPVGSWVASVKVDNDEVYQLAKQGKVNGFSIEGFFADKSVEQSKEVKFSMQDYEEVFAFLNNKKDLSQEEAEVLEFCSDKIIESQIGNLNNLI